MDFNLSKSVMDLMDLVLKQIYVIFKRKNKEIEIAVEPKEVDQGINQSTFGTKYNDYSEFLPDKFRNYSRYKLTTSISFYQIMKEKGNCDSFMNYYCYWAQMCGGKNKPRGFPTFVKALCGN